MAARTSTSTVCARPVRCRQSSVAASAVAAMVAEAAVPILTFVGSAGSATVRVTREGASASPPAVFHNPASAAVASVDRGDSVMAMLLLSTRSLRGGSAVRTTGQLVGAIDKAHHADPVVDADGRRGTAPPVIERV